MEVLKQKQGEESVKLEKRKKAIDIELSEIEPLIREAKDAVGNIKPDSLSEIRSLRMPPDVIRDILEAVLRLMGIFDTSWVSMKRYSKAIVFVLICVDDDSDTNLNVHSDKQYSAALPRINNLC